MIFRDIDLTVKDWLFAREIMRRLGFAPDEILFVVNPPGKQMIENGMIVSCDKLTIVLQVRAQGLEFNWTIGPTDVPDDQIQSHYERACHEWNSACDSPDLDLAFTSSAPFRARIALVQALHSKGFVLGRWN